MKRLFFQILLLLVLLPYAPAQANEPTECTITNYLADYTYNNKQQLTVVEKITVDCANISNKHGIYRTVQSKVTKPIEHETPITLKSITDESGKGYKYETTKANGAVTWKIGDPNSTVSGVHQYWLTYTADKVTANAPNNQTELYWDILGTFWTMPITSYQATFHFPTEILPTNTFATLFDGAAGSTTNTLSNFQWFGAGTDTHLVIKSNKAMLPGQGITTSIMFPADLIKPYIPTFMEKYGQGLWFLLPLLVLIGSLLYWRKYGRDPVLNKPEMVQYEPPKGLRPLELGLIENYGSLKNSYVTATIVDLAVRGYLKITEKSKKTIFGTHTDWELTLLKDTFQKLKPFEQAIVNQLFSAPSVGATSSLEDQKNSFYRALPEIKEKSNADLKSLNVIDNKSIFVTIWFIVALVVLSGIAFFIYRLVSPDRVSWVPMTAFGATLVIGFVFAFLMRRRTPEGAELEWQLEGFKLYLGRAEKYRMEFYEKEGIFEKYLPYAVAFGLTHEWLKRMHDVYQAQGRPMTVWPWYIGAPGAFDSFDKFSGSIDSMISSFTTTVASSPSSSSSGGGGFSGGGGGGGGGGSW